MNFQERWNKQGDNTSVLKVKAVTTFICVQSRVGVSSTRLYNHPFTFVHVKQGPLIQ